MSGGGKNQATSQTARGGGALFVGGAAAILASTCCLGPLVLLMLGISGAWIANLTALEPYRPLFISVAAVALFVAYRHIFRPTVACQPGEVCAVPDVRSTYKILFAMATVLLLVALTYPWLVPLLYSAHEPAPVMKETTMKNVLLATIASLVLATPVWAGPKTVTLTVSNMTCMTCPLTVKLALTKVEGVSKAVVDFDKKEAVVTFDDGKTSAAALVKATTDAGYPSTVKPAQKN